MESRPPIWPPHEVFYLSALLAHTTPAVMAIHAVADAMETAEEGVHEIDHTALLNHLQDVVQRGAAISRYFWPSSKKHKLRGEQLRNALGIGDDSPLHSRELRNALEHFDERLDKFLAGHVVGLVVPEFVGIEKGEKRPVPAHVFRGYYLNTGDFELLGQRYHLPPLAEEIQRLHALLLDCHGNGGRFPRS